MREAELLGAYAEARGKGQACVRDPCIPLANQQNRGTVAGM
jgi:hypothetical protein